MGAVDLLRELMAEGVEFETDGERIKWRNGGTRLTSKRLAVLKDGKAEVLQFLSARPDVVALDELAATAEYDGGLSRNEAEHLAAECQSDDNVISFKDALLKPKSGS